MSGAAGKGRVQYKQPLAPFLKRIEDTSMKFLSYPKANLTISGILTLAFLLFLLVLARPAPAFADGGGWPTATPTLTNTPVPPTVVIITLVPTATTPPLNFAPTPTYTQVVPILSGELASPELQSQAAEPRSSRTGVSWWTCLPFGAVFVGLAVLGIYWLRTRMLPSP